MKRKRFTEEQIIGILKEHEVGVPVADLCRKHGVSDASIYKWKAKFGGIPGGSRGTEFHRFIGRRLLEMSNFCCLPGRAGGTFLVELAW
jgi:transposase-like protein